jgi:predicted metal-binding membrane protein
MIESTSPVLDGLLLTIAGVFQFSRLKHVCLRACRSPLGFLMSDWRGGLWGAWHMGIRHGLYCMGCCWALMALLFAGGVMNLLWIAALTGLVAVEKLAPKGERTAHILGVLLIGAGIVRLVSDLGSDLSC